MLLAGPFLASCALLALAGAQKLLDPKPLVRATRSVGRPLPAAAVRAGAAGEVLLGGWAALGGARVAALLVAASYAVFTGFVLLALRRGGVLASCGCFGQADVPPTATHAVVTAAFAAVALVAAGWPGPVLAAGLPLVVAAAAVAVPAYLVLAVLPVLTAATPRRAAR